MYKKQQQHRGFVPLMVYK